MCKKEAIKHILKSNVKLEKFRISPNYASFLTS